jgi:hypothetical protein
VFITSLMAQAAGQCGASGSGHPSPPCFQAVSAWGVVWPVGETPSRSIAFHTGVSRVGYCPRTEGASLRLRPSVES